MFGRRESKASQNQAAKEQSRRALFEELAKRPPNVCPFLGLASSQIEYHDGFTREHRCYAFGEPAELSAEQQERVCLGRGYGNCPRYLRGVLVIPTEELEALRRQPVAPARAAPPPLPPSGSADAAAGGRRGRGGLLVGLVLLLALAGAGGAYLFLTRGGTGVVSTPTPQPSPSTAVPSPSPSIAVTTPPSPSPTPQPSQTPFPETPKPDPTPRPGDKFIGYEVTVLEGENTLFKVDDAGNIVDEVIAHYDRFSKAPVDRVEAPNGLLHWRTKQGFFTGLSYIHDRSGPFLIRKVYQGSDGQLRYIVLPDSQV